MHLINTRSANKKKAREEKCNLVSHSFVGYISCLDAIFLGVCPSGGILSAMTIGHLSIKGDY